MPLLNLGADNPRSSLPCWGEKRPLGGTWGRGAGPRAGARRGHGRAGTGAQGTAPTGALGQLQHRSGHLGSLHCPHPSRLCARARSVDLGSPPRGRAGGAEVAALGAFARRLPGPWGPSGPASSEVLRACCMPGRCQALYITWQAAAAPRAMDPLPHTQRRAARPGTAAGVAAASPCARAAAPTCRAAPSSCSHLQPSHCQILHLQPLHLQFLHLQPLYIQPLHLQPLYF